MDLKNTTQALLDAILGVALSEYRPVMEQAEKLAESSEYKEQVAVIGNAFNVLFKKIAQLDREPGDLEETDFSDILVEILAYHLSRAMYSEYAKPDENFIDFTRTSAYYAFQMTLATALSQAEMLAQDYAEQFSGESE